MNRRSAGLIVLALALLAVAFLWLEAGTIPWYGLTLVSLFGIKIGFSWRAIDRKAATEPEIAQLASFRVGTAIPVYNEDPELLARCLESLLAQTRLPESIAVIDDCSNDSAAIDVARAMKPAFEAAGVRLLIRQMPVNRGKREALITALDMQPDIDTMLCVDSDTVLLETAVERLLPAFLDDDTHAATGLVLPLNFDKNLLTRLTDVRYANAFLFERAAYSSLGSVLCCCGSLAIYRAALMRKYRDDFLGQTFLGQPAVFGDDRRLTNYALLEGQAKFQSTSVAFTAVPERLGHYARQQVRWSKSFFRESIWAVGHLPTKRPAFWLSAVELASWVVFSLALVISLIVMPVVVGQLLIVPLLLYVMLLAYARSARYFEVTGLHRTKSDVFIGFAIAPLYGVFHVTVLVWLRIYALATLNRGSWGTRKQVEVRAHQPIIQASSGSE
ncbi:glycosyltransferase [Leucobacter viscericola]|uniref:Glycosyltransferase n=1 Tax=Leucobacter viscericola TaxID=2714935 RepID=A0A6G7XE90_9MICO|nr:glycosyltransferase [Leucobacter viscericola]QIK62930.1 glycosyltransferase [Leucobacter viscericola]